MYQTAEVGDRIGHRIPGQHSERLERHLQTNLKVPERKLDVKVINLLSSKGRRRRLAITIDWVFGQDLAHISSYIEMERCRNVLSLSTLLGHGKFFIIPLDFL